MAFGLLETDTARRLLAAASAAGMDLASALEGDDDHLRRTDVAQPALLFVECTLLAAIPDGTPIAAVAGHSVGEYAACVAAGALEPETAMRLVIARGQAMAGMREGTMCAFIGLDADVVSSLCDDVQRETGEVVVVANLNAPGQVVISGSVAGVNAATEAATQKGLRRALPLNVSGAFHSPLMADAARLSQPSWTKPTFATRECPSSAMSTRPRWRPPPRFAIACAGSSRHRCGGWIALRCCSTAAAIPSWRLDLGLFSAGSRAGSRLG